MREVLNDVWEFVRCFIEPIPTIIEEFLDDDDEVEGEDEDENKGRS